MALPTCSSTGQGSEARSGVAERSKPTAQGYLLEQTLELFTEGFAGKFSKETKLYMKGMLGFPFCTVIFCHGVAGLSKNLGKFSSPSHHRCQQGSQAE